MTNYVPKISIIGLATIIVIYMLFIVALINRSNGHCFIICMLIGLFIGIIMFVQNIIELIRLKKELYYTSDAIDPLSTCPDYWKRLMINGKEYCTNININDKQSIGQIQNVANLTDKYNAIESKNFSLTDINNTADSKRCSAIFKNFFGDTSTPNYNDSRKISWTEYQNKCGTKFT